MSIEEFDNISIAELARQIGYDAARLSRYLSGRKDMTLNTALTIANKLDMPIEQFIVAFCARRARSVKARQTGFQKQSDVA
jgi:transcriptional regulator with XRE-family HTH domain